MCSNTSSPSGAAIMAARIPGVGRVTVSLRKSTGKWAVFSVISVQFQRRMATSSYAFRSHSSRWRQKIAQHRMPVFGQDAFRVKLHPFDGQFAVAHAHDFTVFR